jgi:flagellar biosynthesis/type III secretory pathway M-ring protein FliF/YscJ
VNGVSCTPCSSGSLLNPTKDGCDISRKSKGSDLSLWWIFLLIGIILIIILIILFVLYKKRKKKKGIVEEKVGESVSQRSEQQNVEHESDNNEKDKQVLDDQKMSVHEDTPPTEEIKLDETLEEKGKIESILEEFVLLWFSY